MKNGILLFLLLSLFSCDNKEKKVTEYVEVNKDITISINYSYSPKPGYSIINPNRHSISFFGYNDVETFNLKINDINPIIFYQGYSSKYFYFDIPIPSNETATISLGVENKRSVTTVLLPDSIIISEPSFLEVKTPGEDFEVKWNKSGNANYYFVSLNVISSDTVLNDASFFTTNNQVQIPGKFIRAGGMTVVYVTAIHGPSFNSIDPFERKNGLSYRCYSKVMTFVIISGKDVTQNLRSKNENISVDPSKIFDLLEQKLH